MKTNVTNSYYITCPICGATLQPDDKKCPYCGTAMIGNPAVSENNGTQTDHTAYQDQYFTKSFDAGNGIAGSNASRRVDIISQADPSQTGTGSSMAVAFLVLWVCMAFGMGFVVFGQMFAISSAFGSTSISLSGSLIFFLAPVAMGAIGLAVLVKLIKKRTECKLTLANAPQYDAVVIGHSKNTNAHRNGYRSYTYTTCSVKVLANIEGRETCILIKSKLPDADLAYPVGCHVTIAGKESMFMIVE